MERRKFILNSIKSLPFLMFTPTSFGKIETKNLSKNKKVIIVGAGIAGLAAATKLKENGFEVIILEAQEKIGGRIKTNTSLGFPFDEGASWIHGPNGNPISNLAKQAGANLYETIDEKTQIFDENGVIYNDDYIDDQYNQFEKAIENIKVKGSENQSFESKFNELYPDKTKDKLWKYMLSAYIEFDNGGDISNLSSKYLDDDLIFSGKDLIITNGFETITNSLSKNLNIELNTKVLEIDYSSNEVIVTTNKRIYSSDFVLITVPLGVLKSNSIKFIPYLPKNKTTAINNLKMGVVNKFLLVWDEIFWNNDLQYIGYTPEIKGKFNYFMNLNKFLPNQNALVTFAFGKYAIITESMTENQIIDEIMLHLKQIYGNKIPKPTKMIRTKWAENPYSFGSYSFVTNGTTTDDFDILAIDIDKKLFFAGEHTNKNYLGTTHGAYLSGIREADKIISIK